MLFNRLGLKLGQTEIFHCLFADYSAVALVGLGSKQAGDYNENERLNECKENVRIATGIGSQKLQDLYIKRIEVESMGHADAAAEGSILGVWRFQSLKKKDRRLPTSKIFPYDDSDR